MTKDWKLVKKFRGGHRYFIDKDRPGAVAVADMSGAFPDTTEDGVLWLNTSLPLRIDQDNVFHVPLTNPETMGHITTLAGAHEGLWLSHQFGMPIAVCERRHCVPGLHEVARFQATKVTS